MIHAIRRFDPALQFFAIGAACCLVVSIPATNSAMIIFHGQTWGNVATGVFEFGAVGLELMSLWIPQWRKRLLVSMLLLLVVTTLFNYALGVDAYIAAKLLPGTTYAYLRANGYSDALTIATSALFPGMLGGFLLGFTARARMLRAKLNTPMAAVAFWLGVYWLSMRQDMEQHVLSIGAELAQARQELDHTRHELAQRGAVAQVITEEVITIARRELSVRQLARVLELPESTVRRKVAQVKDGE